VIRFSAALVVVAIGVLIGGVATSSLLLVYLAIGVSALALAVLAVGVALKRDELFVDAARPAASGAQERTEQPAGLQGSVSGWPDASNWQGAQSGPAQDSVAAGAGAPWSAFAREDRSQAPSTRLGAWPPAEQGFPIAAAASGTSAPSKPSGLRRPEPPTRADPVLPWADALPTRVDIVKGGSPAEPVPSWLEDGGDKHASPPADRTPAAPQAPEPPDDDDTAIDGWQATGPEADTAPEAGTAAHEATAEPEATPESDSIPAPEATAEPDITAEPGATPEPEADTIAAEADGEATHAAWSPITWDTDAEDTSAEDADTSPEDTDVSAEDTNAGDIGASAEDSDASADVTEPSESAEGKPSSGVEQVTVVPGVPRYHDADCILIRFMDGEGLERTTVAEAEKAGCTPCRACQPE